MVKLFYATFISVDLAHHEIFRAKVGKGGIKYVQLSQDMCFPTMLHFQKCRLKQASTASF